MYNLWYKFLFCFFQHSTVSLYYFNYRVLNDWYPRIIVYLFVVYNVPTLIASFLLFYLFFISKLNLTTWPFGPIFVV